MIARRRRTFKQTLISPYQRRVRTGARIVGRQRRMRQTARELARADARMRTGGFTGIELKFVDTTRASTVIATTWAGAECDPAANTLCAPTQGTGESNRDGRRITIKSVQINGQILRNVGSDQADARGTTVVTVAVVLDTQTNGAQLNAEDVYADANNNHLTFRNLEYNTRFRVLWKRMFTIGDNVAFTDGVNTGSVGGQSKFFKIYKRLNVPVTFTANAGSVADIADNSFHVIACAGASNCYMQYEARCRFVG